MYRLSLLTYALITFSFAALDAAYVEPDPKCKECRNRQLNEVQKSCEGEVYTEDDYKRSQDKRTMAMARLMNRAYVKRVQMESSQYLPKKPLNEKQVGAKL